MGLPSRLPRPLALRAWLGIGVDTPLLMSHCGRCGFRVVPVGDEGAPLGPLEPSPQHARVPELLSPRCGQAWTVLPVSESGRPPGVSGEPSFSEGCWAPSVVPETSLRLI